MKKKKIVSIVGPTACGKTSFALKIARDVLLENNVHNYSGVDLISVDSRQVYKGLEILTGADIPENFVKMTVNTVFDFDFFKHEDLDISLYGVSIINYDQPWSVAHFKSFATKIILQSFKHNRLPILIGGTGLYHQHLFNIDENLFVPPNQKIREQANEMTVLELQQWLLRIGKEKFESMNNSDINNPRRIIRAIEILVGIPGERVDEVLPKSVEKIIFGMQEKLEKIENKIRERVIQRFDQSVVEVTQLLQVCKTNNLPVCSTLGVSDIHDFLDGKVNKHTCQLNWALHEYQYAKRQVTWFKKQPDIIWLDDGQKKQYTFK